MSEEFLDYLEDILDAMDKAEILVEGYTYDEFETDFRTHLAVTRTLEVIGEATKRLPAAIREKYPNVPWKDMAGMRDRISHGYDTVNLRIVWDTVTMRIPVVKPLVRRVLLDYEQEPGQ